MRTIKLNISYDGTDYKGWQLQKNGRTIQGEMEKAVERIFGTMRRVHGSSRTDSGVHAISQTAHFKTALNVPISKVAVALNAVLPSDISVLNAEEVPSDFHSRFDAKRKLYRYHILNSRQRDPFKERYSWRVPYNLDISLMKKEAAVLKGRHDFRSFQACDKRERSSVRKIYGIRIKKKQSSIIIDVEGDGFLYNMVRNITGTIVEIGRGYLPPKSMHKILLKRDRSIAGPTAPAKGLFLIQVIYS